MSYGLETFAEENSSFSARLPSRSVRKRNFRVFLPDSVGYIIGLKSRPPENRRGIPLDWKGRSWRWEKCRTDTLIPGKNVSAVKRWGGLDFQRREFLPWEIPIMQIAQIVAPPSIS